MELEKQVQSPLLSCSMPTQCAVATEWPMNVHTHSAAYHCLIGSSLYQFGDQKLHNDVNKIEEMALHPGSASVECV